VSFLDERKACEGIRGTPLADQEAEFLWLSERGLPPATSVDMVAYLFGFSRRFVTALKRNPDRYYRKFRIPKGRGHREIRSPRVGLKVIQKWFGHHLARSPALGLPSACHGFVPGRSLISAAREHRGAGWVYSTDIRDFFGAVSS